jgi:hypothetical protein
MIIRDLRLQNSQGVKFFSWGVKFFSRGGEIFFAPHIYKYILENISIEYKYR